MNYFIDTSILIQFLTGQREDLQNKIDNLFETSSNRIFLQDAVLIEAVFVLERHFKVPRAKIEEIIGDLFTHKTIICNKELFINALKLYIKRPKLSFYDCMISSYAKLKQNYSFITLDKKMSLQVPEANLFS